MNIFDLVDNPYSQTDIDNFSKRPVPQVEEVLPSSDYSIKVIYKTGESSNFNMLPLIENDDIYKPLKDFEFFKSVRPHHNTVEWPTDIDIAPEVLYSSKVKHV